MARVATGDRAAFAELVDATADGLFRYLRSLVRSDEAAEDVLQEVLVGVWKGARGWSGERPARVWMYGVARRQAARSWRRRVGEPADPVPLEALAKAAGFGDDAADPERLAEAAREHERLHAALSRLSDDDREVIVLRDLEGFTGPEVASLLEVELGAVKSRLHRARMRLMSELRSAGGADVSP